MCKNVKQVLVDCGQQCPSSDDASVASSFLYLIPDLWRQQKQFMLCDGDLRIDCVCIHGQSHLQIIYWGGGSKWYIWFLWWWWLLFHSNIVRWGICGIFSSGEWVNQRLIVIVIFFWYSRWRCRELRCGYGLWYQCWGWSRCCQRVCDRVRVMSHLGSGPNSRCWFMGTQSKQFLFEGLDTLFQGELEKAYYRVGQHT